MIRKLVRWAPLVILPIANYTLIRMNTHQQEPSSALQFTPNGQHIQSPLIDATNITQNQAEIHQPQAPQEQLQSKPQQQKPQQLQPEAIKQSSSSQQQMQQSLQPQNYDLVKAVELKNNEAVVDQDCAPHLVAYLSKANYKIYRKKDLKESLVLKNSKGDQTTLDLQQVAAQRKDGMQLIANFINPPTEINTIEQARQMLNMHQDSFLIASYLPTQQNYDQLINSASVSQFDTFTTSRKANLPELEERFTSLAYNSSSAKNSYLLIRSREVADYLRINRFNVGVPYIINKTSKYSGNQSNNQWQGSRYHVVNLSKEWKKPVSKQVINHMTHFYINKIDTETDAYNKIRQIQMSADKRKVLLVYTKQDRPDFHHQLDTILEKVGRVQKDNAIIIKTQNEQIVRKLFKVEPDHFTTVRLINLSQLQKPLFPSNQPLEEYYSRCKLNGPFKYENICNFLNNQVCQQYYESKKKLTYLKTASAAELKKLDNTLVLLEKQGCQGCKYVEETLDELKKVAKAISTDHQFKNNLIYRYQIEDPNSLTTLKIRRYSIFNESLAFTPPKITPKLFLFSQGKYLDLKVDHSLGKIKEVKSEAEAERVHDLVLADIINSIRMSKHQAFSQW